MKRRCPNSASLEAARQDEPASGQKAIEVELGRILELRMLLALFDDHQDEAFTGAHLSRIVTARLRLLEGAEHLLSFRESSRE